MRSLSKGLRQNPILYLFLFIFFYMIYVLPKTEKSETTVKVATPFRSVDSNRNSQEMCALPDYEIWSEDVEQAIIGYNPMKDCDKSFEKWTELENSTWRIVKDGANCKARCFTGVGAIKNVVFQDWIPPGHVDCEFLEAACWVNDEQVYGYIHTQVIPKIADPPKPIFSNPPNVFIFTIDSMNTGMARRFLPKFVSYFENELKGVEFPFVNKVGENSQPNGFPLWFGKSIETGVIENWKEVKPDWNATEHCATYLDNSTHIFKEFKDHGYTTLLLEDWANTMVDSWPFCKGFKESPADHIFRPFTTVLEKKGTEVTKKHLNGHLCRETHHATLEYLSQAIHAYNDRPIFSWVWLASLAHSYLDGVARADDYLVEYFKKHQKIFENSFVFFLADHGLRFVEVKTEYMETEIASFERHNSHLAISVTKKIREENPDILSTLRMNSRTLQTHYDTRATLMDILKIQPMSQFKHRHQIKIRNEKGNSLIRRQPDTPRTCTTLPIPLQYCICQVDKWKIQNNTLKLVLGQRLVDHVQRVLFESGVTEMCEPSIMTEVSSLIEYGYSKLFKTYKLAVQTNNAHFESMLIYDEEKDEVKFTKVVRLDNYGDTADCTATIRTEPLCHCKDWWSWLSNIYSFSII
ncbi:unnamed protein product [Caenorhabditis brenneri]